MAKKYPGLYLYFDWLKNLERLPKEVAMEIILNLYHYTEERREPKPLCEPPYEIVQEMLLDQVKRSLRASDHIKRGISRAGKEPEPPLVSIAGMSDEEVIEYFRTHEEYADDDPYELLHIQRIVSGERKPRMQSSELNKCNISAT